MFLFRIFSDFQQRNGMSAVWACVLTKASCVPILQLVSPHD